ncbi:Nitroreductase [Mesobacillus persicus]|uniref:Putative NAD(P)H nitroreductase n=1 Tax=Mesobacillus persicus TaxID=930146 RepID=A0A1H8HJ14_9BACI|nr:nitroreductase [Mesobacillus persicus]SEN55957.1 Nitroreductase [Mesobacillus persicus]
MDVFEAIKSRRSNGLVSDKPVPKEIIDKILEAGTWAPSHFKTEPWKFFVLTGEGRLALGKVLAEIAKRDMENPLSETNQKKLEKICEKPLRAPVVMTVAVEPNLKSEKVIIQEEYGAVYAAIQNMLLAAHALGLGGYWRTGKPTYDPLMKELFGLSEKGEVLGFLYFGYTKREMAAGKRRPYEEVTKWLTSNSDFDEL